MWNCLAHLLIYEKFVHLPQRPRKNWKVDFRHLVPRKSVRVRYYWKGFLKLYNLSFSDSSFNPSKILKIPEFSLTMCHSLWVIYYESFTCKLPGETTTSLGQNVPTGSMDRKSTIFDCESLFRLFCFLVIWNESALFRWFSWWIFFRYSNIGFQ